MQVSPCRNSMDVHTLLTMIGKQLYEDVRNLTDEELYAKYGFTDEEITFIESLIRSMDLDGDDNGG